MVLQREEQVSDDDLMPGVGQGCHQVFPVNDFVTLPIVPEAKKIVFEPSGPESLHAHLKLLFETFKPMLLPNRAFVSRELEGPPPGDPVPWPP